MNGGVVAKATRMNRHHIHFGVVTLTKNTMTKLKLFVCLFLALPCFIFSQEKDFPVAKKIPYYYVTHGDSVLQNYYWMRTKDAPEVINYLNEENTYADLKMKPSAILQKKMFEEMRAMMKENHKTTYEKDSIYFYYSRNIPDQEHPLYCRKKGDTNAVEQVYLNANELQKELGFFQLQNVQISDDHSLLAYAVNTEGGDFGTLYFKHIDKDSVFKEQIANVGSFVLIKDNKSVYYMKKDAQHKLGNQVFLHVLGTDTIQDVKIYESMDNRGAPLSMSTTFSKRYLLIENSFMNHTGDVFAVDLKGDLTKVVKLYSEKPKVRTEIDHYSGEGFNVFTNEKAPDFLIKEVNLLTDKKEHIVFPEEKGSVLLSATHKMGNLYISRRKNARKELLIFHLKSKKITRIPEIDSTGVMYFSNLKMKDTFAIEFGFSSMKTQGITYSYDLKTNTYKVKEVDTLQGYNPDDYVTERVWAPSRDGKKIPVDLVYKKTLKRDGSNPLYITGYGCYGMNQSPTFNPTSLLYLKRGFVYALAHPRGESILGDWWHKDGMLLKKENTIHDFVDATQYLIDAKYTKAKRVIAQGGSAGGLLMGGIANERPEIYGAIIADVPFVNTLEDMLDTLWPNIKAHFDEIGNPYIKKEYDYIKSYSPLHNIKHQNYPSILVTNGYNDSRVPFWAAAQYTARLRELKTDTNWLLLKTNMSAGHGGSSGRYGAIKDEAFKVAFAMQALGVKEEYLTISGKVVDAKGEVIPYANVLVERSSNGTVTNLMGEFTLDLRQGQNPTLVVRSIGYKTEKYAIGSKTRISNIAIVLQTQDKELETAVIHKNNKNYGYEIIKKANQRRPVYNKLLDNYSVDVYIKGVERMDSVPKKLPKFLKAEMPDSNDLGLMGFSESVATFHFKRPDNYKEEMKSSRVAGVKHGYSNNRVGSVWLNLYENSSELTGYSENQFVSPIGDGGILLYKYKLESSFVDDGNKVYKIKVTPRNRADYVYEGYVYIQDQTYSIHSTDLFVTKRQGLNFIDTLYFKQSYGIINDSVSVPISIKSNARIKIWGFDAGLVKVGTFYNYQLNKRFPKKFFHKQVFAVAEDAVKKDSVYWDKNRPVLLTQEEQKYNQKQSVKKDTVYKIDSTYLSRRNKMTLGKLFLSGYERGGKVNFSMSALLPKINYNTVEGWNNTLNFNFSKFVRKDTQDVHYFSGMNGKTRFLNMTVRYGTDSKKYYGKVSYGINDFDSQNKWTIGVEKYIYQYNREHPIFPFVNSLYSLLLRENYMKLYEKTGVNINYSDVLISGPQIKVQLEYAQRNALLNHSQQWWIPNIPNHWTSNNPLAPEKDSLAFKQHNAFVLRTSGSYTFGERYELLFGRFRQPIGSRYPTMYWNAEQGIKTLGSSVGYTHVELGIGKSMKFGYWGKFNIDVIAGGFLNKKNMYFIDYKHFNGNQTHILKNGTFEGAGDNNRNQLNSFNALSYYSFSTNDAYLELHAQHRFLGVLTAKVPLVNRLHLGEVVGLNAIYTSGKRNYQEVFLGVDNLFKVFRVDFVASYKVGEKLVPQVRIGVKKMI